ncbi:hypothetical protein ACLKA6_007901 [Drosophila palustris]
MFTSSTYEWLSSVHFRLMLLLMNHNSTLLLHVDNLKATSLRIRNMKCYSLAICATFALVDDLSPQLGKGNFCLLVENKQQASNIALQHSEGEQKPNATPLTNGTLCTTPCTTMSSHRHTDCGSVSTHLARSRRQERTQQDSNSDSDSH